MLPSTQLHYKFPQPALTNVWKPHVRVFPSLPGYQGSPLQNSYEEDIEDSQEDCRPELFLPCHLGAYLDWLADLTQQSNQGFLRLLLRQGGLFTEWIQAPSPRDPLQDDRALQPDLGPHFQSSKSPLGPHHQSSGRGPSQPHLTLRT